VTIAALLSIARIAPGYATTDGAICNGCQLSGIGDSYHFWCRTGGLVLPATLTWSGGRYELGIFRFATTQILYEDQWAHPHVLAEPYWGVSASRRWQLFARPTWQLFFGFGASYKAQEDALNSTRWNFASQLTVKLRRPSGKGSEMEFALRHWSNAGIRTPNRGQDFFTVTIAF
jgi:Lipid A 3-O-deacylase (PagL)